MADLEDLPYKAEYSKSNRASCKSCKTKIEKEVLRIAVMVQSPMFDGKVPHWYHVRCFFIKQRPKTIGDIANFETLRYEDQEDIKKQIETASDIVVPAKKGKKRGKNDGAGPSGSGALKDFTLEYAKSGRAMCRGCEQKILKDEIRISKKDFESDVGKRYGGQDMWHHLECFAKLRSELKYFETGEVLPGFHSLSIEDKKKVKLHLPAIKQEEMPEVKKPKLEDEVDGKKEDTAIKEQSKILYKYRDQLKESLNKKELQQLLEYNNQQIPVGVDAILDRLADVMTFGALVPCEKCGGQYVFTKSTYTCEGNLTEWSKCLNQVKEPKRKPFKVPDDLKECKFLKKYKYTPRNRVVVHVASSASVKSEVKKEEDETDSKPKVEREKPALYDMNFIIVGVKAKSKLTKDIQKLGGKVLKRDGGEKIMAVISIPEEVADGKYLSEHIQTAKDSDYHVVSEDFVAEAKDYVGKIPELVIKKSISSWGSDPKLRLPVFESHKSKSKSKSMYTKSVPKSVTMKLKGGGAVDPDSGLDDIAHVYQQGKDKYTVVLGLTDLQKGKNSYYKLQLLESDNKQQFWVFRSWGRISTTIGGTKVEKMHNLGDAKKVFKDVYEEKTGNEWSNRENFVKVPGKMYPIDVDYGQEEEESMKIDENDVSSKLARPVQDLVKMIFDVNSMKQVMKEFELDMEKMPLGKLSKKQIQSAFSVLSELQTLVNNNGSNLNFIDACNRFYTFIPHSFGMDNPPILNTTELIKEKLDMLDSLLELEIAYSLMKCSKDSETGSSIDGHYNQLKTEIEVMPKDSEDFKLLCDYVKNTHAATHTAYELEVDEVFTIKRQGEEKRFKPFKKLHNRKLLWHGSRTTNFAGILAQGLRIAPPEAPVTGYMFGKGIYFADMVSKSANYCCTSPMNNTGLMLLCDVALGDMYERHNADYIEKLPKGKHSCKGCGMTQPNPKGSVTKDGIEIPCGKAQKVPNLTTSLLYNEYIVYDIAQVNVKYLLKMKFKYNV